MGQMVNMLRLDKKLIFRDKIAVYIIIVPIVMSFIILMALKAVENDNIRIAVANNVPESILERISRYTDIEMAGDMDTLQNRVNEFDNIPGAYWDGTSLQVLFQGNEGVEYEESIRTVLDAAMNTVPQPLAIINVATGRDVLTQMLIAVLLTAPVAIGGIISGFTIITEKETDVSRAYRIAPLSTRKYFISRYLVSITIGLIILLGITLVLGVGARLPAILFATVFAFPLFASPLILIGGIAKDKMGCISMIKVIMLVFLCLPIAAAITPEAYRFFYYPFPVYWHYKSMESVLKGSFSFTYGVITFVGSGVVFVILASALGKKIVNQ